MMPAVMCLWPHVGPSWSWSYGSWIYLCNQCLSPLMYKLKYCWKWR